MEEETSSKVVVEVKAEKTADQMNDAPTTTESSSKPTEPVQSAPDNGTMPASEGTESGILYKRGTVLVVATQPPEPFSLAIAGDDVPHKSESSGNSATFTCTCLDRVGSVAEGHDVYSMANAVRVRRIDILGTATLKHMPSAKDTLFSLDMAERHRCIQTVVKEYSSRVGNPELDLGYGIGGPDAPAFARAPRELTKEEKMSNAADMEKGCIDANLLDALVSRATVDGKDFCLVRWHGLKNGLTWEPINVIPQVMLEQIRVAPYKLSISFPSKGNGAEIPPPTGETSSSDDHKSNNQTHSDGGRTPDEQMDD